MANQIQLTIEFEGFRELSSAFRSPIVARYASEALKNIGLRVRGSVKKRIISGRGYSKAPFQTGRLYKSIQFRMNNIFEAAVYPTVSYAIYPHEGLSTSRAYGRRPFLEDAVTDDRYFIENEMKVALDQAASDIAGGL